MSKIAITDYFNEPGDEEVSILGDLIGMEVNKDTEILMVWHQKIDEKYVSALPSLRGVQRYGVGFDNLDLEYLNSKGILCCNNPDYGVDEVSDTALAFIMSISRGINRYDVIARSVKGTWQENINPAIKRNNSTTIGVIGAGRIGSSVLIKCKSIGFNTLFYDPYKESGHEKVLKSERTQSLEELLSVSDIVSIHCPLNSETKGMINNRFIAMMKQGASLVNTARGGILESTDILFEALKNNKLDSVALDVLPFEPPKDDSLINAWRAQNDWIAGRLLINPHTSYYSQDAFKELRLNAAKNALRMYKKESTLNKLISV